MLLGLGRARAIVKHGLADHVLSLGKNRPRLPERLAWV